MNLDLQARMQVFVDLQTPEVKESIQFILSCDPPSQLYAITVISSHLKERRIQDSFLSNFANDYGIEDAITYQVGNFCPSIELKNALRKLGKESDPILLNLMWVIATAVLCSEHPFAEQIPIEEHSPEFKPIYPRPILKRRRSVGILILFALLNLLATSVQAQSACVSNPDRTVTCEEQRDANGDGIAETCRVTTDQTGKNCTTLANHETER